MRGTFPLRIVVLLAGLLLGSCAREAPLSTDQKTATRQVTELLPVGMTAARAKKVLMEKGFQLSRLSTDHDVNYLMVASYSQGERNWQVGVLIVSQKVVGTSVAIVDAVSPRK